MSKVATVGHSLGGVLAASVAALANESGLPGMLAVMSVEPGLTRSPANVPMPDLKKIPANTLLLSVAGDRDTLVEDYDAKRIYYESTQIPSERQRFRAVSDRRARPTLR
jgi:pimeloyl-ACP methyl ester carboxylesterase